MIRADREKRFAIEPGRDEVDDLAARIAAEHGAAFPGKQSLIEQELVSAENRVGSRVPEVAPGRRTLAGDLGALAARSPSYKIDLGSSVLDVLRSQGLQDVLSALDGIRGGPGLIQATRSEAKRATRAPSRSLTSRPSPPDPSGKAMWQAAERRAATIYRRALDGEGRPQDPTVEEALRWIGGGHALPEVVRQAMERELGVPLGRVRVHTDSVAADAARAVRAEAFTVGEDIFFADGAFAPDTDRGARLLAHELAHVVQNRQGQTDISRDGVRISDPSDHLEREAETVAERIHLAPANAPAAPAGPVAPPAASVQPTAPTYVQRQPLEMIDREKSDDAPATDEVDPAEQSARTDDTGELTSLGLDARLDRMDPAMQDASMAAPGDAASVAASGLRGVAGSLPHLDILGPLFGIHELGNVQAHTGEEATTACAEMGASAYATGASIAFGGPPDVRTAAHEAAHVVQQRQGRVPAGGVGAAGDPLEREADAVANRVMAGEPVGELLGPAAVTGGARAVQLDGETVPRGGGTYTVRRGDTLWAIAALTYGHGRYWTHIRNANSGRVFRGGHLIYPGARLTLPRIQIPTLVAMRGARGDHGALRDLAVGMSDADYGAFLAGLSADERAADAQLLGLVELMRSTRRTPEELSDEQRRFLEAEAARQGTTAGELVRRRVHTDGYGGGTSDDWDRLSRAEQRDWRRRFDAIVRRLHIEPPADVRRIIRTAEQHGGGFRWDPARAEELGAFAYTSGDWSLHCGVRFVEAAEGDLASVYANLAHEMGGHNVYGDTMGNPIIDGAIGGMSAADQATARSDRNHVDSAYGYMETEIFAELYEASYDRPDNPTDRPFDSTTRTRPDGTISTRPPDVRHQLQRIREAFAPDVAEGIVRSLALRVQLDSFIHADVKERFREQVIAVFGDILPAWSNPPAPAGP